MSLGEMVDGIAVHRFKSSRLALLAHQYSVIWEHDVERRCLALQCTSDPNINVRDLSIDSHFDVLKVVQVSPVFPPDENGTANVCYHNSLELSRRGFEVTVLTPSMYNRGESMIEGVRVVRLNPVIRLGNASVVPALLKRATREGGVVHLHLPFLGGAEFTAAGRILAGRKYACTYHNDIKLPSPLKHAISAYHLLITENVFNHCNKWIVPSMAFAKQCQISERIRESPNKVVEIPNGIDTTIFSPETNRSIQQSESCEKQGLGILFVGVLDRAHNYKGLDVLMKSIRLLREKRVKLTVVGEGESKRRYIELANSLGLGSLVQFVGAVKNAELPAYYRSASCVVVPSKIPENMSLVTLEAMSCGKPVVASRFPSTEYLIRDRENGLLFKSEDHEDLASKIGEILDDDALGTAMGKKGRDLCVSRYSWESVGTVLAQTIEEIED